MKEDKKKMQDPQEKEVQPPFDDQEPQDVPGTEKKMQPKVDHGEESYKGS
ncbi:NAD(P)-dependent oxidoreductase, partial [Salinimicrobium sp. CDJ15-91]|nr:NAD(P)-dependent oxidoreductase [Salinimicrobium oceani]